MVFKVHGARIFKELGLGNARTHFGAKFQNPWNSWPKCTKSLVTLRWGLHLKVTKDAMHSTRPCTMCCTNIMCETFWLLNWWSLFCTVFLHLLLTDSPPRCEVPWFTSSFLTYNVLDYKWKSAQAWNLHFLNANFKKQIVHSIPHAFLLPSTWSYIYLYVY